MTPSDEHPIRVAIIGAGIAGASCARLLADAGFAVTVFDKSRGVGGRMATRRAQLIQPDGTATPMMFDHGVPWFDAQTPEFEALLCAACESGFTAQWSPRVRTMSVGRTTRPVTTQSTGWTATPDMPALCRWLLHGVQVHAPCAVQALQRHGAQWQVMGDSGLLTPEFDAVVVAIPARQAAELWRPIRPEWAERGDRCEMEPCWTLMATTGLGPSDAGSAGSLSEWDVLIPSSEVIALIVRQDRKPGRSAHPDRVQWVVHAHSDWSKAHLESSPVEVQALLLAALERALAQERSSATGAEAGLMREALESTLDCHHAVVHRWRYAQAPRTGHAAGELRPAVHWWDASMGLGACGDHFSGAGVEGAWHSGRALALAVRDALT